jgi:arylsulfatase A-like enzyme
VIPTPPAVGVNNPNGDYTTDFDYIKCYDQLKVNAVMNWIDGFDHLRTKRTRVPAIFGMNFQAVSVGEKLIVGSVKGGYSDAQGEPTGPLLGEIKFVDAAIGSWVAELRKKDLLESTTIIITAKHGQSPIDPNLFVPIPGHAPLNNGMPPSAILGSAYLPDSEINQIGATEDDISLLWLSPGASTANAVSLLEATGKNGVPYAGVGQIFWGHSLRQLFDKPGLPFDGGDPRTPDIIIQPNVGVIYTGSLKKQAEHGGFSQDDTNVMLLVSNPSIKKSVVASFVETSQVAPTVLKLLGFDPNELLAVRKEGTPVLPGLFYH